MSARSPADLSSIAALDTAAIDPPRRWIATALLTTAVLVASLLLLAAADFPRYGEDSYYYRELALGNWSRVNQPFSARFLQPVIVQHLSAWFGCPVDTVFCAMALIALTGFVLTMAVLLHRLGITPLLLLPTVFCWSSVRTLQLAFMPEQFYTLLLGVFFLLLARGFWATAAVGLVVLFCERESTILLGASILFALFWTRRSVEPGRSTRTFLMFFVATVAGVLINRQVSSRSAGNIHHINSFVYLLVKAPYNFLKNVLGLEIWTNTLAELEPKYACLCKVNFPAGLHVGGIHAIGIAEINPVFPCYWLYGLLSTFGVLLTVIAREFWIARSSGQKREAIEGKSWRARLHRLAAPVEHVLSAQPRFIQIAAVYGLLSFALVPVLGSATARYVFYAWPAFWLMGIAVLSTRYGSVLKDPRHRTAALTLLLVHLAMIWPLPSLSIGSVIHLSAFGSVLMVLALHVIAWSLLNHLDPHRLPAVTAALHTHRDLAIA